MTAPLPSHLYTTSGLQRRASSATLGALAEREGAREAARRESRDLAFRNLPQEAGSQASQFFSVKAGCHPYNLPRNRYRNLEPYDRSRVVVGTNDADDAEQYFQGNWVREYHGGKWWIATQAPLRRSMHTFFSIMSQPITRPALPSEDQTPRTSRIRTVVQLTPNTENGMRKADPYLPSSTEIGDHIIIPHEWDDVGQHLTITVVESQRVPLSDDVHYLRTILSISKDTQAPIKICHLFYPAWPDFGVPRAEDQLLEFARVVDETNRDIRLVEEDPDNADPDPPIMVHCSAGIGRTGSFIALCSVLRAEGLLGNGVPRPSALHPLPETPLGPPPKEISQDPIALEVDSLRDQRPGMVQRDEQIHLIHEILLLALQERTK